MAQKANPHIIVVEDEPFLAAMYKTKLELEGFTVERAVDGQEAVSLIAANPPDLVLLDIVLPKLDGFGVLKTIRGQAATAHVPVIMLTNLGQQSDISKGLALGANDYIIKANYTPAQVVAKVKEHLGHAV